MKSWLVQHNKTQTRATDTSTSLAGLNAIDRATEAPFAALSSILDYTA
jgi:hypothetical protein